MFAVKLILNKAERTERVANTIRTIKKSIKDKLNSSIKFVSDNDSVEIISGAEKEFGDDTIITELTFRKVIAIKKSDFKSDKELDEFIEKIKGVCEKINEIEEIKTKSVLTRSR